jgi:hypothetical protein
MCFVLLSHLYLMCVLKDEPKPVKNMRKREYFERKLEEQGAILEREIAADGLVVYIKIHVPFTLLLQKVCPSLLCLLISLCMI